MKINLKLVAIIVVLIFGPGCSGGKKFEQIHHFPGATWHRFDILAFDLPIKNTTAEYTVYAIMQYTDDFGHDRIPLHFIMNTPSGEERIWEQTIVVRDKDGDHTGKRKDGIYELIVPVRSRLQSTVAGTCHITVEQYIPKYDTQGIVSFGLRLSGN